MSAACAGCGERSAVELFRRPPQHDPTGRPFAIVRCERCGVERLDPLPTEAELDEAYAAAYYEDRSPDTGASGVLRRIAWRAEVRPLMPLLSRGVRVLELGCGTGSFLAQLRQWFDVDATGQERSAAAAEEARRRGIRVIEKALADADLPAKAFDVVIMRHVLEHVPDPRRLLATARRVIADGGALLVTVPVTGGWDQRAFGPSWDGYEIPEHLWLFPRGVLTRLFHDAGFTVQERRESFVPNPWVNGTQRVLERRGAQRLARFFTLRNPISLVIGAPVGVAAGLLGRSGRLTVVARPVAT